MPDSKCWTEKSLIVKYSQFCFVKYFQTAAVAPVEDSAPALTAGVPTVLGIVLRNNRQKNNISDNFRKNEFQTVLNRLIKKN